MVTTEFIYSYMSRHKFAVLSTVSPQSRPEAAYVGIAVTPDLKVIFDTVSDSRKYVNLKHNHSIAFVIGGENERTLQYEGLARIPRHAELETLLETYFGVFPDGRDRRANWKNIAYFCVEPKWLRYSDFNGPEPRIDEITF